MYKTMIRFYLVVPCFNEEKRLALSKFKALLKQNSDLYIIFIDDGSTDKTFHVLQLFEKRNKRVKSIRSELNRGKANSIKLGFDSLITFRNQSEQYDCNFFGWTDADNQISISDINRLLDECRKAKRDSLTEAFFASRSRIRASNKITSRKVVSILIGRLLRSRSGLELPSDIQCGLKMFRLTKSFQRAIAQPFVTHWFVDWEIILRWENMFIKKSHSLFVISEFHLTSLERSENSRISFRNTYQIIREILLILRLAKKRRNLRNKANS